MTDLSRRKLLTGFWQTGKQANIIIRPPWSVSEVDFIAGSGGFPEIDFQRAECSFCQACVQACEAVIFTSVEQTAWQIKASISDRCLPYHQVECRSCQDSCETRAIKFRPRLSGIAQPELDLPACTGCRRNDHTYCR